MIDPWVISNGSSGFSGTSDSSGSVRHRPASAAEGRHGHLSARGTSPGPGDTNTTEIGTSPCFGKCYEKKNKLMVSLACLLTGQSSC